MNVRHMLRGRALIEALPGLRQVLYRWNLSETVWLTRKPDVRDATVNAPDGVSIAYLRNDGTLFSYTPNQYVGDLPLDVTWAVYPAPSEEGASVIIRRIDHEISQVTLKAMTDEASEAIQVFLRNPTYVLPVRF